MMHELYRSLRRIAARLESLSMQAQRDLALWCDIRVFPPLAVLAGLGCVSAMIVLRERSGGPPLRLTDWRLCLAATAAAALTIGSRWLLGRIERESPAFWMRVLLAAGSVLPIVVLL